MVNVYEARLEDWGDGPPGFALRRARIGRQAGCERLGASVWELPPGQASVYHWHVADEELLFVLVGSPSLRTPAGWRVLETGEVVAFQAGERGAHQLLNETDEPVRVLIVSEMRAPEITVYPDSEKIAIHERGSGTPPGETGLERWFRLADDVAYFEGETPPKSDA